MHTIIQYKNNKWLERTTVVNGLLCELTFDVDPNEDNSFCSEFFAHEVVISIFEGGQIRENWYRAGSKSMVSYKFDLDDRLEYLKENFNGSIDNENYRNLLLEALIKLEDQQVNIY